MIFLQIIGAIFVVLVVLVLFIYLYFRRKLSKFCETEISQEPLSISLNEALSPEWLKEDKAKTLTSDLEKIGYKSGPAYSIYEIDAVSLQPFFCPPFIAVLYKHDVAGYWVDIVADKKDKKEYTFSNAPMGGGMDQRPECNKSFNPEASVSELHLLAQNMINGNEDEFVTIEENAFREYFESAYKKEMAWKNRKGGISFDEFSNIEQEASFSTSKENIEQAFVQTKLSELEQWHEAALEEHRHSENITEDKFYELEYKLIIVPFTSHAKAFLEYLEDKGFINDEQLDKFAEAYATEDNMHTLFDNINKRLSPKLRAKEVAEYSFPLELKIYQLSEDMCN